MTSLKLTIVGILSVLLVILVVQNAEVVTVRLLLWDFEMSRVVLIVLTAVVGFVCGYAVARLGSARPTGP